MFDLYIVFKFDCKAFSVPVKLCIGGLQQIAVS